VNRLLVNQLISLVTNAHKYKNKQFIQVIEHIKYSTAVIAKPELIQNFKQIYYVI